MFQVFIVGKPNVGKSTLFNKFIKQRKAIVDDQPGVTRDAVYGEVQLDEHRAFRLVDTCGIFQQPRDLIESLMKDRTLNSLHEADLILFVVNGNASPTSEDFQLADAIRPLGKPVIFVVNKTESSKLYDNVYPELFALGFGEGVPVSAEHKLGIQGLLDDIEARMSEKGEGFQDQRIYPQIKVTISGKPNVGKSMLLNSLVGKERALVTPIPGTTRDPIDEEVDYEGTKYLIIDSAGIRKRGKVDWKSLESFSISRAQQAIKACDVVLLLIDIQEPVSEQDQRIAGIVEEEGRASVIVYNKIDTLDRSLSEARIKELTQNTLEALYFVQYSPVVFISAKEKTNLSKVFEAVNQAFQSYTKTFSTGEINRVLERIKIILPEPSYKGQALKMYYATQVANKPPIISIFVNDPKIVPANYKAAMKKQFRKFLDPLIGSPLFLKFVPRREK